MRIAARPWMIIIILLALIMGAVAIGEVTANTQQGESPRETIRIDLQADGDARLSVLFRFSLDSPEEIRAFEQLAEEFEEGTLDEFSPEPFRNGAALAAESTGRPMTIEEVNRTATRTNETGTLTLAFTWTAFAQTDGDRLAVGDVFTAPSGTWLPELTPDQELIIVFPDEYTVVSSSTGVENRTFHIRGPHVFEPGEPSVTLDPTGDTGGTSTPVGIIDLVSEAALPVALVLLLLVLALVLVVSFRRRNPQAPPESASSPVNGSQPASDPVEIKPTGNTDPSSPPAPVQEELLSDEERVIQLLDGNGGRMKQANIVDETDWSNAKVSQLLSEMEDREMIEKLRIGRENLISLPNGSTQERE